MQRKSIICNLAVKLVFMSVLALFAPSAQAVVQSNQNIDGLNADSSNAAQGFAIVNGNKNQAANLKFGGGLMLIDQTLPEAQQLTKRRSIVNNNGVLYRMDQNGTLLKILLSTDLDNYDPLVMLEQLDGFTANTSYGEINAFSTVLEAFETLAGNQNLIASGDKAFNALRLTGGTAANDVILKTNNNKVLQAQLGVPGTTYDVITKADLSATADRLLEVNGKTLSTASPTASFKTNASSGKAYTAKLANQMPEILLKLDTGVANQIQVISGSNVVTLNPGNSNITIPGTNLQVDSFDGSQIVFEKANANGFNNRNSQIVLHYFGQQ